MPLSPDTVAALEAHGVTQAHFDALLRFFQCQRNGCFAWHGRDGRLEQCELRVVFPGKAVVVSEVSQRVCAEQEE